MADNRTDFEKQEEQLRSILLRILIGLFIAVASLLFAIFIPFYPISFAVVLAIALGALAYRAPALSLGLMFFFNMPGYIYQGGFSIGMVVTMGMVCLVATLACLGRPGACLVIAAGVIAGIMMFTPAYFLSIPLLVSVILFRARGIATGSPAAIMVFLAVYNSFLILTIKPGNPAAIVPLFQQVKFPLQPPLSVIELSQMVTALKESLDRTPDLLKSITVYWPLLAQDPSGSVGLVGRPLGFILYFITALSIAVAFGTLSIFRWMAARDLGTRYMPWLAPTLSLIIADVGFLFPLSTLRESMGYTTTLSGNTPIYLVMATVGIGLAGSAIELGLKGRDTTLEYRQKLTTLFPQVKSGQEGLQKKLSSIRELSPQVDFHDEEKLLALATQELGYLEGRVGSLPTTDLQTKIKTFSDIQDNLQKSQGESEQKLLQSYDESKEKYDTYISRSFDLGISGIEVFRAMPTTELGPLGFERVKEEQKKLNEAFDNLGQCLVAIGKDTASLIATEVDQEFKPFGLDIAQNYLATRHSQEAVDSMLSSFLTMRDILDKAASGLVPSVEGVVRTWDAMIKGEAIQTLNMMGDEDLAHSLLALKPALDKIVVSNKEEKYFSKLVLLVRNVRELNQSVSSIVTQVIARIKEREKIIESKVPQGFDWEKNNYLPQRIAEVQEQLARKPKEASLGNRLMNIELALNTIGEGVALIRQYIFENEFLINFANIQYLISLQIEKQGQVSTTDLPVRDKYAHRYLVLYTRNHYDRVSFDSRLGILTTLDKI